MEPPSSTTEPQRWAENPGRVTELLWKEEGKKKNQPRSMLRSLWAPGTKLLCPERHLILQPESCFVFFPQLFAFLTTGLFDRGTRFSHDERSQNERPFGNIYPPGWRSSSGPDLTSRCSWSSWSGSAIYWAVCSYFSLNPIRSCVLVTETRKKNRDFNTT